MSPATRAEAEREAYERARYAAFLLRAGYAPAEIRRITAGRPRPRP